MSTRGKLGKYVELFKRYLSNFLSPGIRVSVEVYPAISGGAVFVFVLNGTSSSVQFHLAEPTLLHALRRIPQSGLHMSVDGRVEFRGTNIYMEGNRVIVIKGDEDPRAWEGEMVRADVQRVISTSQGGRVRAQRY